MALQDIFQTVLHQARQTAESVQKDAEKEKEVLNEESAAAAKEGSKLLDERKEQALERLNLETNAMASRKVKIAHLNAKNAVIKVAMDKFYDHLVNLPEAEYKKVLTTVVGSLSLSGKGKAIAPKNRTTVTATVLPSGYEVVAGDVAGGLLIEDDGAVIDSSFKNLIFSEFKADLESFFAGELDLF